MASGASLDSVELLLLDPNFLSIAEKFLFFRDKIGIIWILWEELIEENEEHHLLHRNTKKTVLRVTMKKMAMVFFQSKNLLT